jgi:hypothetical protein
MASLRARAASSRVSISLSVSKPWAWSDPTETMINEVLPEQRANGVPRDDRNEDVRHKDRKNQQKSPTHLSRFPLIGMYAFPVRRCRHILYGAASAQSPISC